MLRKQQAKNKNKNKQLKNSNGFFIEAGAGDGEIISNSLYFEEVYKVGYYYYFFGKMSFYLHEFIYDIYHIIFLIQISGLVYWWNRIQISMTHCCPKTEMLGYYLIVCQQKPRHTLLISLQTFF